MQAIYWRRCNRFFDSAWFPGDRDARESSGIAGLGDLLEPRVSSLVVPAPGVVEKLTESMTPDYEKTTMGEILHFIHLRGRAATLTARTDCQPIDAADLVVDTTKEAGGVLRRRENGVSDASPGPGSISTTPTGWGLELERATESHPGQALAVLGALGVPLDRRIRLGPGDEGTLVSARRPEGELPAPGRNLLGRGRSGALRAAAHEMEEQVR